MKLFGTKVAKNSEEFLRIEHLANDLKGRTVRGGAVTLAAQICKFLARTVSTIFLARLLTPEDYGLVGMVTVITGFVELFKDLGLSAATVQKDEVNHKQVSTLFWINLGMSLAIALFVAGMSPLVAWFYSEPRLTRIMLILSTTFIISGLTVQHQALLRRQMKFLSIAKIEIVSMLFGVITALILAWQGFGYWSLVYMQISTAFIYFVGVWIACRWRPGWPSKNANIKSMVAFGRNLTAFRSLNYFSRNFDNVVIGRVWGAQELGLYAKAYQLLLLPITQINGPIYNVALSALSRLQTEPERYRSFYCKAILTITTLGMPLVAFMFASSDKVISVLLGPQWLTVVPIFQFLAPAAFIGTFNVATGWVYQSLGRTDRQLRWGIVSSFINVSLFLISAQWRAIGVAAAYGLSQPILMTIEVVYCYKNTPLKPSDLLKTLAKPMIASLGSAAVLIGLNYIIDGYLNALASLALDCLLYSLFYLGFWFMIPGGKSTLLGILSNVKDLKRGKA